MKIKIIFNPLKSWAEDLAADVKLFLLKHGHEIVSRDAAITVCIGGDGTILYGSHQNKLEGKILGIGSKRSYICQLHRGDWRGKLEAKLKESTVDIFSLEYAAGKTKGAALNDVVVHSNDYRVLELSLKINRKKQVFLGDGLIISSSVGSTGYAYSAGGKALKPTAKKLQLVPIAPYRRRFNVLALPSSASVAVAADRQCALIIDGIYIKELKRNETVSIRKGKTLKFFKGVGWNE